MRLAALGILLLAPLACRRDSLPAPPEPVDAAAPSADVPGKRLLDDGREPRVPIDFAFVPGKREARVLEVETRIDRGGALKMHDRVQVTFDVRYPSAEVVELVVRRVETEAKDVPNIGTTAGAIFKVKLAKDGAADPPEATFPQGADGTAKSYVEGAFTQVAALLRPVVPPGPIGEGARWRAGPADAPVSQLVSRGDKGIVVDQLAELRGPRRVDRGKIVQVDEDHKTRIDAPPDGIARHIEITVVEKRAGDHKHTTLVRFDTIDAP